MRVREQEREHERGMMCVYALMCVCMSVCVCLRVFMYLCKIRRTQHPYFFALNFHIRMCMSRKFHSLTRMAAHV